MATPIRPYQPGMSLGPGDSTQVRLHVSPEFVPPPFTMEPMLQHQERLSQDLATLGADLRALTTSLQQLQAALVSLKRQSFVSMVSAAGMMGVLVLMGILLLWSMWLH